MVLNVSYVCLQQAKVYRIIKTLKQPTMSKMLTAYCMKTKEKNVPMQEAVITKTSRGGYMAQGHDGKGNKMTTMLSEANALEAVKNGVAKQSW
ncbi:hypothetical protein BH09BAC2_BH09BAC2_02020 [soil metagenome]